MAPTGDTPTSASTRSRREGQHALDRGAAHRVADEREALGAELVGDGEEVAGRLVERLVALLTSAVTEAAHVGEDPAGGLAVEVVDERAPAGGRAEPAMGEQDGARAGPDDVVGDRHDSPSTVK